MKTKISFLLLAAVMLLQGSACGAAAKDGTVTSPPSIVAPIESSDTAEKRIDTDIDFSSLSSRRNSDTDESTKKEIVSRNTASKAEGTQSKTSSALTSKSTASKAAKISAVSSKSAVSSAASSMVQTVSGNGSKTANSSAASQRQPETPKTTVSVQSEEPKTESTTTVIETPQTVTYYEEEPQAQPDPEPESALQLIGIANEPQSESDPEPGFARTNKDDVPDEYKAYCYPYDYDAITADLIAYGESLGMVYDSSLEIRTGTWEWMINSADSVPSEVLWYGEPYYNDYVKLKEACYWQVKDIYRMQCDYDDSKTYTGGFNVILEEDDNIVDGFVFFPYFKEGEFKLYTMAGG